jgi:hypothetical protein
METAMSDEHLRVILVLYSSALIPLFLIPLLSYKKLIPSWSLKFYVGTFIACSLGWEIWFTYGVFAGDPVDARRAAILSEMIPIHINWVLNSLADAGSITMGGLLLTWLVFNRDSQIFRQWNWSVFTFLIVIWLGQNIFVEMFLYHDQLAEGTVLSWAPFAPLGPWVNPILFDFNGRTISFQGQVPWLIMTPVLYLALIRFINKHEANV